MSSKHGLWAWKAETEDNFQRNVLLYLAFLWEESGPIQVKLSAIMAATRHEERSVRNAIRRLVEYGYLEVEKQIGSQKGDFYSLNVEKIRASTPGANVGGEETITPRANVGGTPGANVGGQTPPTPRANVGGEPQGQMQGVSASPPGQTPGVYPATPGANAGGHARDSRPSRAGDFVLNALKATAKAKATAKTKHTEADVVRTHSARENDENYRQIPAANSSENPPSVRSEFSPEFSDRFVSKNPLQSTPVNPDSLSVKTSEEVFAVLYAEAEQIGRSGARYYTQTHFIAAIVQAHKLWGSTEDEAARLILKRRRKYVELETEERFIARLDNWLRDETWKAEPKPRIEVESNGRRGANGKQTGRPVDPAAIRADFEFLEGQGLAAARHLDSDQEVEGGLRAAGPASSSSGLPRRPGTPVISIAR